MRQRLLLVVFLMSFAGLLSCGGPECGKGLTACGSQCVDSQADPAHCGSCGNVCATGQICSGGSCQTPCPAGLASCQGSCTDISLDTSNCGECGIICAVGFACVDGVCGPPCGPGESGCSGVCADLKSDLGNCGSCGNACTVGEVCSSGMCAGSCGAGLTNCSGSCVDLQSNPSNCGFCGFPCGPGLLCSKGACASSCATGLTDCGGLCVDTQSNSANCGGCGMPCAPAQACIGGMCQAASVLVSVTITPDNDVLTVDLNKSASKNYAAIANFGDGSKLDVTSMVSFSIDNSAVGHFVGSSFTSSIYSTNRVEFGHVRATYKGMTGTANLTAVFLRISGTPPDVFFPLPQGGPDQSQALSFKTYIQSIDAFFAVDTTGSMGPETTAFVNGLSTTIAPAVKSAAAKDAYFGVGAVEDFGMSPFGTPNCSGAGSTDDQPFILLQAMTSSLTSAQAAAALLLRAGNPRGCGNDTPEGQMEALYQIATGLGNVVSGVVNIPPHMVSGTLGGVEFRKGALPVITLITDASFHAKGETGTCNLQPIDYSAVSSVSSAAHTRSQTVTELNKVCAKVIGISAEGGTEAGCLGTTDLVKFADSTGAAVVPEAWGTGASRPSGCATGQCCTGIGGIGQAPVAGKCRLVYQIGTDGSGLTTQAASGISNLALYSNFGVTSNLSGSTSGDNGAVVAAGHTTADFIKTVVPKDATASPSPVIQTPVISGGAFSNVVPGAGIRYDVKAQNGFQAQTTVPQVFHTTIKVLASGCADLDQRDVIILVPPLPPMSP